MDAKTRSKISEGLKRFYRTGQKAVDETVATVKTNVKTTAKKALDSTTLDEKAVALKDKVVKKANTGLRQARNNVESLTKKVKNTEVAKRANNTLQSAKPKLKKAARVATDEALQFAMAPLITADHISKGRDTSEKLARFGEAGMYMGGTIAGMAPTAGPYAIPAGIWAGSQIYNKHGYDARKRKKETR